LDPRAVDPEEHQSGSNEDHRAGHPHTIGADERADDEEGSRRHERFDTGSSTEGERVG
jgi:hypothetical protein